MSQRGDIRRGYDFLLRMCNFQVGLAKRVNGWDGLEFMTSGFGLVDTVMSRSNLISKL